MDNLGSRLQLARDLVAHLEAGNQDKADELIEQMARECERSLFIQVGRPARDVHDALKGLNIDERICGLAEHDLADAKRRLHAVHTPRDGREGVQATQRARGAISRGSAGRQLRDAQTTF